MKFSTLVFRGLKFYARSHLGVVLGAAVGSAALIGALIVGDSVRISLRDLAMVRLGRADFAMASGDRLFRADLGRDLNQALGSSTKPPQSHSTRPIPSVASILQLPGVTTTVDGSARANHVQILGVGSDFWQMANQQSALKEIPADGVALNEALAQQLKVTTGDTVLVRVQKPSLLSRDAPISSQNDSSVTLRLKLLAIISDDAFGRYSLQANQTAPFNAFVNLAQLQEKVEQTNRVNVMLLDAGLEKETLHQSPTSSEGSPRLEDVNADFLNGRLAQTWQLADAELELRNLPDGAGVELRSSRVFLDPAAVAAAQKISPDASPLLTYFVNELRVGSNTAPYSMVTAMGAPIVPASMKDDEILINDWLATDLNANPGDRLALAYFVIGNGRALEERTNEFTIREIVPMTGAAADRGLMPDFPGLAQADSSSDWDAGFPIQLKKIRTKDEQYWKQFRGTPKAFITLAAGQKIWANRFGDFTAIRFPKSAGDLKTIDAALRKSISPVSLGLGFQPVREQALVASAQGTDFGGLFIGFSFFLIVAALLLMGLLFQFGLEQRAVEIGTLLALGFRPRQVRRLFLREGMALSLVGGIIGAAGGIIYARAMLLGLGTIWRSAVGTSALRYHATPETLVIGIFASTLVGVATIWLALRRQAKRPARELMAQGAEAGASPKKNKRKHSLGIWVGPLAGVSALAMIFMGMKQKADAAAETFFGAGSLLLIAGLGFAAVWLARIGRGHSGAFTLSGLGLSGCGRRRTRSLATIGLLACGVFLIVAIGAFRIDANQSATQRSSGTGGFALIGESALPVTYDLNSSAGREFYGLSSNLMVDVKVLAFRVRDGDEASCLNLNRAQKPRVLGVNAAELQQRGAFTFAEEIKTTSGAHGWDLLKTDANTDEIPAIGDENSILWAMGKKVGDTVDYTDSNGHAFKLKLVGAVANSMLQGSLIIDEAAFVKRFADESGYRMFLIDAPPNRAAEVSAGLTRALQDAGLEMTSAAQRLNLFNAVQNTYLSTFQVLGGLGLLLGSAGLGVVVLRNVQERRGELALLLAVGFRRGTLQRLILSEHGALLGLGLGVGVVAALIGVLPALVSPGSQIPYGSLALTLVAVLLNGLLWTWVATRLALRGRLLSALRNE